MGLHGQRSWARRMSVTADGHRALHRRADLEALDRLIQKVTRSFSRLKRWAPSQKSVATAATTPPTTNARPSLVG